MDVFCYGRTRTWTPYLGRGRGSMMGGATKRGRAYCPTVVAPAVMAVLYTGDLQVLPTLGSAWSFAPLHLSCSLYHDMLVHRDRQLLAGTCAGNWLRVCYRPSASAHPQHRPTWLKARSTRHLGLGAVLFWLAQAGRHPPPICSPIRPFARRRLARPPHPSITRRAPLVFCLSRSPTPQCACFPPLSFASFLTSFCFSPCALPYPGGTRVPRIF